MIDTPKSALFPVLPLRDIVVFPHMIVPLFVGREKSIRALEEVMREDKQILLVAQKNAGQDDPGTEDIYRVGTVSSVLPTVSSETPSSAARSRLTATLICGLRSL